MVKRAAGGGANDGATLKNLSTWLTVGTPFVVTAKSPLLYSRMQLLGRTLYVAVLMITLVLTVRSYFDPNVPFHYVELPILAAPLLVFHLVAGSFHLRNLSFYSRRVRNRHIRRFGARWVPLAHPHDEAIQGLRSLQRTRLRLFAKTFLIGPLSASAVFVIPATVLFVATSHKTLERLLGTPVSSGIALENTWEAILFWTRFNAVLADIPQKWANQLAGQVLLESERFYIPMLSLLMFAVISVVAVQVLSRLVSYLASVVLDWVTWKQIRRSALGGDTPGEHFLDAGVAPAWFSPPTTLLPTELALEITDFSDRAATISLPKVRAALSTFAFAKGNGSNADMLADYVTWDELIHCSYFSVPRFRLLVAYAISQS